MLAVVAMETWSDRIVNYGVLCITPLAVLYWLLSRADSRYFLLMSPFMVLTGWVCICVLAIGPKEYWPDRGALVTIFAGAALASQVAPGELRQMRYALLVITAAFNAMLLTRVPELLAQLHEASGEVRIGADVSPANVVALPRAYFTLALICVATVLLERRLWLRGLALALSIVPLGLGLGAGSRGPTLAFAVALTVFLLGVRRHIGTRQAGIVVAALVLVGYALTMRGELLAKTRLFVDDTERGALYALVIEDIMRGLSLVGRGPGATYAHNLFLEFLQDYGICGLAFCLVFLSFSLGALWRCYRVTHDVEVAWLGGVIVLQLVAQQFSLNIYTGSFWTALLMPIGLAWWQGRPAHRATRPFRRKDAQSTGEQASARRGRRRAWETPSD